MTKRLTDWQKAMRAEVRVARTDPEHKPRILAALIQYLQAITGIVQGEKQPPKTGYSSYYALVLDQGEAFEAAPRPKGLRKQRNRQCYANALHLALRDHFRGTDALRYVEGYAMTQHGIPVEHAWCVTDDDLVVDPTWEFPETGAYYGIVIPLDVVSQITARQGVYGVLPNDWRYDCHILTTGRIEVSPKLQKGAEQE